MTLFIQVPLSSKSFDKQCPLRDTRKSTSGDESKRCPKKRHCDHPNRKHYKETVHVAKALLDLQWSTLPESQRLRHAEQIAPVLCSAHYLNPGLNEEFVHTLLRQKQDEEAVKASRRGETLPASSSSLSAKASVEPASTRNGRRQTIQPAVSRAGSPHESSISHDELAFWTGSHGNRKATTKTTRSATDPARPSYALPPHRVKDPGNADLNLRGAGARPSEVKPRTQSISSEPSTDSDTSSDSDTSEASSVTQPIVAHNTRSNAQSILSSPSSDGARASNTSRNEDRQVDRMMARLTLQERELGAARRENKKLSTQKRILESRLKSIREIAFR
ncbi:hypothetical protein MBLNU230_g0603t1 [Neophaeotheca triangularis]